MSWVGGPPPLGGAVAVAVGQPHLVDQLAAAGDVGDPLVTADLHRDHVVELVGGGPVGERPHVLGREAVGADQRHLFQLLAFGLVHDHVVAPAFGQGAFGEALVHVLGDLGQEVGLEDHLVEGDAEPGQGLALAGDHPGAGLRPQFQRLLVATQDPHHHLVGFVVVAGRLAGDRVLGAVVAAAAVAAGGDVVGVTEADEVVALLVGVGAGVLAGAGGDPGHRLSHAAADVADQAAVLDLRPGLLQRPGDRVADGEVAKVADVQRLGRVGAPEVDRVAVPGGHLGQFADVPLRGADLPAAGFDPLVAQGQLRLVVIAIDRRHPRLGLDSVERRPGLLALAPILALRQARDQHQVAAGLGPVRRPRRPQRRAALPCRDFVEPVEDVLAHSLAFELSAFEFVCSKCTRRGSNPDLRLTTPTL